MYLYENHTVFFILLVELIATVVFLAMEQLGYARLLKECERGEKDSLVVRNIKEKKINVSSVDNFVNKYVNNFEFCGLKLYTIKRICGQLLNLVFITWCIISVYGIYLEVSIKDVLWTTMLGILVVGGLFSVGYSVDNSKYERIAYYNLKNSIEEYIYFNNDDMQYEEVDGEQNIINRRERFRKAVFAVDKKDEALDDKYTVELKSENLGYLADYYKEDIEEKKLGMMDKNNYIKSTMDKDEEVVYNLMKEILS